MILEEINGKIYVKKQVDNVHVYKQLQKIKSPSIPFIKKIKQDIIYYEFIEGQSLRAYIEDQTPILSHDIFYLIKQLIDTLSLLQQHKIIHKDIKPENIIVSTAGQVYLIDFGAARLEKEDSKDTHLLGTEYYASPEHYGYAQTTFKSDIYSLGKIIQELDQKKTFTDLQQKCCAIDPANRYNSYEEMKKDLEKKSAYFIYEQSSRFLPSEEIQGVTSLSNIYPPDPLLSPLEKTTLPFLSRMYAYFGLGEAIILVLMATYLLYSLLKEPYISPMDVLIQLYACLIILDFIDYIAFLVKFNKRKGKNKGIFIKKIAFSLGSFIFVVMANTIHYIALR